MPKNINGQIFTKFEQNYKKNWQKFEKNYKKMAKI